MKLFKHLEPIEIFVISIILIVTSLIIYPFEPSPNKFHTVEYNRHTYVVYDGG